MPFDNALKKVLVIGSGPIVIGQAAEFDYAGTQACLALKEEGVQVVLVNNNPATIMTDLAIVDYLYMEPLTVESLARIIEKERPDGLIATLGGQTGLNLATSLDQRGILGKYGVRVLGTSIEAIHNGEDREAFRRLMLSIGEPIPESKVVFALEEGIRFAREIGYPLILRPAYTLGGEGGGFAHDEEELRLLLPKALSLSPIGQVLLERSIYGWKEIEYEVMRDANDTTIMVCNMENLDPVGVHTGDSIVVAPAQTLSDRDHQMLRDAAKRVIRALGIVGGCNIQFALHPESNRYMIIEVNPRVSRSSALASKATGYPIARIATKLAIGYRLDEIINPVTGHTFAAFEPTLDYVVVKLPRFPFDKFFDAERKLGTQMKATGEAMAIDRSFDAALHKALRSLETKETGLLKKELEGVSDKALTEGIMEPHDLRLFYIGEAFRRGMEVEQVFSLSKIDRWFLYKLKKIADFERNLTTMKWTDVQDELLIRAKEMQIPNSRLAALFSLPLEEVDRRIGGLPVKAGYKMVDTCAAEFEAFTPYFYSTWKGRDEGKPIEGEEKYLVIGSGPIRIGQGVEFDYASVHAVFALKEMGKKAIVVNNNPETVSTDFSIADRLYFEPLDPEDLLHLIQKEGIKGVLNQFGGQTAVNLSAPLAKAGIPILGPSLDAIDQVEDRERFYALLERLSIPHIRGRMADSPSRLMESAEEIGFPILVRPSYVIGGQSMYLFHAPHEVEDFLQSWREANLSFPTLLVDQYLPGLECEVDLIADGEEVLIPGVFEHVERAGVHSGDSYAVFPSLSLSEDVKERIEEYARQIARELHFTGLMNIQFLYKDGILYVLEVNPRASRTVPIVSKLTRVPMVEWAVETMFGKKLADLTTQRGLMKEIPFYALKAPIFSTGKLKGVDPVLSPEMKSTGEVLALGLTLEEAVRKAAMMSRLSMKEGGGAWLLSIADREKEKSLPWIKSLVEKWDPPLYATKGTARFLQQNGIEGIDVIDTKEAARHLFAAQRLAAVIDIPNQGRRKESLGYFIREMTIRKGIPLITCLDTLRLLLNAFGDEPVEPRAIHEYWQRESLSSYQP